MGRDFFVGADHTHVMCPTLPTRGPEGTGAELEPTGSGAVALAEAPPSTLGLSLASAEAIGVADATSPSLDVGSPCRDKTSMPAP